MDKNAIVIVDVIHAIVIHHTQAKRVVSNEALGGLKKSLGNAIKHPLC